jgi:hypothetical protein
MGGPLHLHGPSFIQAFRRSVEAFCLTGCVAWHRDLEKPLLALLRASSYLVDSRYAVRTSPHRLWHTLLPVLAFQNQIEKSWP